MDYCRWTSCRRSSVSPLAKQLPLRESLLVVRGLPESQDHLASQKVPAAPGRRFGTPWPRWFYTEERSPATSLTCHAHVMCSVERTGLFLRLETCGGWPRRAPGFRAFEDAIGSVSDKKPWHRKP